MTRRGSILALLACAAWACGAPQALAGERRGTQDGRAASFAVYPFVEHFQWKEFDQGVRILKESGTLQGAGAVASFRSGRALYRLRAETSWGEVDYDGQTQAGEPARTEVTYLVVRAEGDAGLRLRVGRGSVEPFWGLGYRWWRRDLEHSAQAVGYLETWQSLYLKAGARAEGVLAPGLRPFAEAALRLPVYNRNRADMGFAAVSLEPGHTVTPRAEAGLRAGPFEAALYYEWLEFPRSPEEIVDVGGTPFAFYQPKSRGSILGGRLGVIF